MPILDKLADKLEKGEMAISHLADGSAVLIDQEAGQVITLNETAAFILQTATSGVKDSAELGKQVQARYGIPLQQAQDDLADLEADLAKLLQ